MSASHRPTPGPEAKKSEGPLNRNERHRYEEAMSLEATTLMGAVQSGDPEAFNRLSTLVRGRGFRLAHNWVGSHHDALDLCQEALLKVFKSRDTYDPSQPFLPWFHRILRNTCFSFLRKNQRIQRTPLTQMRPDGEEYNFEIIAPTADPSEALLESERAVLFHEALAQLSERDREMLTLRHFEDLSYRSIAETLGIPEGTVMSRLFHARRRLREHLEPLLDEDTPSDSREPSA